MRIVRTVHGKITFIEDKFIQRNESAEVAMLNAHLHRECSFGNKPFDPAVQPASELGHLEKAREINKVLVVDDETDLADLTTLLLQAYGLEAIAVYSAVEALRWLEHDSDIDAVLSDVAMPGMDGLALGDAIREMYPQVKVILVSGYIFGKKFDGREFPYLFATKPYTITTILKLLKS